MFSLILFSTLGMIIFRQLTMIVPITSFITIRIKPHSWITLCWMMYKNTELLWKFKPMFVGMYLFSHTVKDHYRYSMIVCLSAQIVFPLVIRRIYIVKNSVLLFCENNDLWSYLLALSWISLVKTIHVRTIYMLYQFTYSRSVSVF